MKLKPCPFCNSKAVFWNRLPDDYEVDYEVGCSNEDCIVSVSSLHCGGFSTYSSKKAAIAAWNKRAEESEKCLNYIQPSTKFVSLSHVLTAGRSF